MRWGLTHSRAAKDTTSIDDYISQCQRSILTFATRLLGFIWNCAMLSSFNNLQFAGLFQSTVYNEISVIIITILLSNDVTASTNYRRSAIDMKCLENLKLLN